MADNTGNTGNLGQYKVVVAADYSNLSKGINDLLKTIQDSADGISSIFSKMADNIEKTGVSSKSFDSIKQATNEATAAAESLSNKTKEVGNSAETASQKYKTLQSQLREARLETEKTFGTSAFDKAKGNYDSILSRLTAFKTAIGDNRETALQSEQKIQQAIDQSNTKQKEYISNLKAQQNQQSNTQYWKDIETQQKRNSELLKSQMQSRVDAENQQKKVAEEAGKAQQKAFLDASKSASLYESVLGKVRSHLLWMASASVAGGLVAAPFEAIRTIADVEKQMAGMEQVLDKNHKSQESVNAVGREFITIAQQYGMSVDKIIDAGKLWGRGYKEVSDIMQLTGLSAKLAVADMMDVGLANRAVESVINGFGRQADAVSFASHVVDSWTNIAHNAQSSATDLAEALMRSGAAAHAVGVSLDETNALASTMIKTTGLEGANIGNALKSIFSSIHSDKAIADLKELGIEVTTFDQNGKQHFRDVGDVITDLMLKTHETSQNMAKDLQDIAGGKFQWSKAAALFGDYADFIKSYNLSIQSTGFSEGQIAAQMDTISRKSDQVKASLTGILTGVGNSGLSTAIKGMLDSVNNFLRGMQEIPSSTYQAIGTISKFGAEAYIGYKALTFLGTGLAGIRNALISVQAAKTTDTISTIANTSATNANSIAKGTSANTSKANTGALAAETIAKEVDTAATVEVTAATSAWTVATTVATGGLNLLIGALVAAAIGGINYTSSLGEQATELDKLQQKNQDAVAIKEQEVEMSQKQTEFIGTLGNAYIRLTQQLKDVQGNEEKVNKTKKDLEATENELTKIVGEDGLERIKSSNDVKGAIKDEQDAHTKKTDSIKDELAELKKQQIEYTRQALQSTIDRIDALKSETSAWGAWARAQQFAMNQYAALANIKVAWNEKLANMFPEGSVGKANAQKDLAYWQNEQTYAQNYKPAGVTNEIAELEQKANDLRIKLGQQEISAVGGYNTPQTTSTGGDEVPPEKEKKRKGRKVDNSPERIAYDYFVSQGYSKEISAGIVGNLMTESGMNPDITAGDGSGSYGIGQWLDGRLEGLNAFASANYSSPSSLDTQLAYVNYELKHGESGALGNILTANPSTPEAAAYAVSKYYERPAWAENPDRQSNAREIYDKYAMGEGGKYEALDPAKQREKFYADMKKSYEEELQAEKNAAAEQGRFWKSNDTLYLFQTMLGQVGKDIPTYETERLKLQQDKQKEDQDLLAATYARNEALTEAGIDNIHKIEANIKDAVSKGQPLGKYQEKIYESMLKSSISPSGSPEKIKADTEEYKEIANRIKVIQKEEQEVIQKHIDVLEKMVDAEIQYKEKLHLISPQEALNARQQVAETKYQQQLPQLQSGLTTTAKSGSESAMLEAYKKFESAKSAEEAKASLQTMLGLSKDEDATIKAVGKMIEVYDKYAEKRKEYENEVYEYENRYQIAYINAYQNAWSEAFDATLNKTRSFAENARNIFKSLYESITKQLSTDFASKWTASLSKILLHSKSTNNQQKSDSQSTANQLEQDVAKVATAAISADTQKQISSKTTSAMQKADSASTKTSVMSDLGTMLAQMLEEMAIMYVLSALFGGGGSSTSTSTSTVSLGRNPGSYYTTPSTISQITVPSMDIGGELPSDMLIQAHKGEWVLTPDQVNSIKSVASNNSSSTSNTKSSNIVLNSNFNPSLIDSRGIKDVYNQTSKDMIKTIKQEYRRFNTQGLTNA